MPPWYKAVGSFMTGSRAVTATPEPLDPNGHACCRILVVAEAYEQGQQAYIVSEGQPAAIGMPVPAMQADGSYTPLELLLNNTNLVRVVGSGTVRWYAEYV